MADAYARFAIEFEADLSRVQSGMAQGLQWGNQYGQGMGQGFSGGFMEGLAGIEGGVNMLTSLKGRFTSTAQGISEIFGMKAGADMAYFRRQLTGMIGDAGQAQKTLDGLVRIANTTNFGNSDIMQMASSALGSGTSAQNLEGEISSLLDASAAMGVRDMGTFRRMSRNFFDLRGKPGEANQRDVNELYRAAPQFVFQAAKVMGTSAAGAREQIQSMSGGDLYDLIVKIGDQNKGKAAQEGMADPFVAAANAVDQFNTAMAPTGELLNRFVTPFIGGAGVIAGLIEKVNILGGGIPGLLIGFGALRGGMYLYSATIGRATFALNALAVAAERAAITQADGPVASAAMGAAGAKGAGAVAGKGSALGKMFAPGGALGGMDVKVLLTIAGYEGASKLDENKGKWWAEALKWGSAPMLGSGGMAYYGKSLYDQMTSQGAKSDAPIDKAAEKIARAADKMSDATATGYGYGARGKQVLSSVEAGYALLGAERLGVI